MKKLLSLGIAIFTIGTIFGFSFAQAVKITFPDVKTTDWFYNDVMNMVDWGVIQGNSDGTFAPSGNVNRAELSAMWNRYEDHLKDDFYSKDEIDALIENLSKTSTTTNEEKDNEDETEDKSTDSKTIEVNSKGTLNGVSLTIKSVEDYEDEMFPADENKKYVSIDVLVENNSGKTISINALNFTLKDTDNYEYRNTLSSVDPAIVVAELEGGRSLRGFIAYEVPEDVSLQELKYEIDYGKLGQFYVEIND